MKKRKLTDYGIKVKSRLLEMGQTQTWLVQKIITDTGKYVDGSYLYKILTGERSPSEIINSISKILKI